MKAINIKKWWKLMGLFVGALMFFSLQAQAQVTQQSDQVAPEADHTNISDDQISAFAKAQSRINQIQLKYNDKFAQAGDDAERQDIARKANQHMVSAIEAEGLNVEIYNQILKHAQNNPDFMQRVSRALEAIQ
jgi:hypothetical protein